MDQSLEISTLHYLVLLLLAGWLALQQSLKKISTTWLNIAARWYRMGLFSLASAVFAQDINLIDRPLHVLVLIFTLAWLMMETAMGWLMVSALSKSNYPLFPAFSANLSGLEWPLGKSLLRLKNQIKDAQFVFVQSLKSELGSGIFLRMAVFQHVSAETRLHVYFTPDVGGAVRYFLSFHSVLPDGKRISTDNLALPFGGFYPETWELDRRPRCQNFLKLKALHEERKAAFGRQQWARFDLNPLDEINQQQRMLERLNLEMGFLNPVSEQEEHGKLSYEGRYRVWVELLLLNYFGISRRYR